MMVGPGCDPRCLPTPRFRPDKRAQTLDLDDAAMSLTIGVIVACGLILFLLLVLGLARAAGKTAPPLPKGCCDDREPDAGDAPSPPADR